MSRILTGLALLVSLSGCASRPGWGQAWGQGTADRQKARAVVHDPYTLNDIGPEVVGGRHDAALVGRTCGPPGRLAPDAPHSHHRFRGRREPAIRPNGDGMRDPRRESQSRRRRRLWAEPAEHPRTVAVAADQLMTNVLVIGKGGREHALVWKLRQSMHCANILQQ